MGMSSNERESDYFIVDEECREALALCTQGRQEDWKCSTSRIESAPDSESFTPSPGVAYYVLLNVPSGRRFIAVIDIGTGTRNWLYPCSSAWNNVICDCPVSSWTYGLLADAIKRAKFQKEEETVS